jgi:hypothetical protein
MSETSPQPSKGLLAFTGNWIGLLGVIVTACSLLALLILLAYDLVRGFDQPYLGVVVYIALPGMLLGGLALIGAGLWYQRHLRLKGGIPHGLPHLDLNNPLHRRNLVVAVCVGFVFLLFSAFGSIRAYHVTESVAFCGLLCHQVMEPEHTAYMDSPHSRLRCTECHIGPGAEWFVRAKISGLRQVYAVLTNSFSRPIPVPVENLRPARGTCEQCHWPDKFYGDLELRRRHYLTDTENTPFEIRMLLKVGGANPQHGPVGGIHWHMVVDNEIEYIPADKTRQSISWVKVTNRKTGKVVTYQSQSNPLPPEGEREPTRLMDCIDCHNRPTHLFKAPNEALDLALWLDRIDPAIPSIKLNAAQALVQNAEAESQSLGVQQIAESLSAQYPDYPDQAKIQQAIAETQDIYRNNFFPEMKTNWQVRPDNIGHVIWPGCFRCHDGNLASETGETISTDCNACHTIVSQRTGDQPEKTDLAGLPFDHPGGPIPEGLTCNLCHTGAP